jgi:hypothetical protein
MVCTIIGKILGILGLLFIIGCIIAAMMDDDDTDTIEN